MITTVQEHAVTTRVEISRALTCALLLCLLAPGWAGAGQFVEIAAEIHFVSYRSGRTNAEASAKPRTISVICTTGTNGWRIENGDVFTRGVGTLKSMREVSPPRGLFNPSLQQTIVDWRFHDEATGMNANVYPWNSASVPQIENPVLQDRFKERVERARWHKESYK